MAFPPVKQGVTCGPAATRLTHLHKKGRRAPKQVRTSVFRAAHPRLPKGGDKLTVHEPRNKHHVARPHSSDPALRGKAVLTPASTRLNPEDVVRETDPRRGRGAVGLHFCEGPRMAEAMQAETKGGRRGHGQGLGGQRFRGQRCSLRR